MLEAIKNRRSVRFYKSDPVSDEQIEELIKAAQFAPSAYNNHAIEFVVVKDQATRKKIYDLAIARQPFVKEAPALIIPAADAEKTGHPNEDIAVATENLFIQATEMGLGSVWKQAEEGPEAEIKKLLNIPERFKVINILPVGYPVEEKALPPHKDEEFNKDKIHQEKW
jgi:nitroreductase